MIKGHTLVGKRVIGQRDGTDLGSVKDLIFDHDNDQILALLLSERDLFGLIDAQIVRWEEIHTIGDDAIIVENANSRIKAGDDSEVRRLMSRDTVLSGTRVFSTDGKALGTLGDVFINRETGRLEGYEISGGFVADRMSGKHFMAADERIDVGRDVAFVPSDIAASIEGAEVQPDSLKARFADAGERISDAYSNIANASVEQQKTFVVGKTAAYDVVLEPLAAAETTPESVVYEEGEMEVLAAGQTPPSTDSELLNPAQVAATDVASDGAVVPGEVLVRQGEIITAHHADRAFEAGVLHALVAAAAAGATQDATQSASQSLTARAGDIGDAGSGWSEDMQRRAEAAAVGQPAQYTVTTDEGQVIVAEGEVITDERMAMARRHDKQHTVVAAAGLGAASATAHEMGDAVAAHAGNLWDAVKNKTAEWTHAAEAKKKELDDDALQQRIANALGRPVTKVILDEDDNVILNTGDIITHKAIAHAQRDGALDSLLDSVYEDEPKITPEMMRLEGSGQDALKTQREPTEQPDKATLPPKEES